MYFDYISLVILNTQITISFCTNQNIYTLIKKYNNTDINLKNLDLYLRKNIWNQFYSLTISLLNLSTGITYNYTVPPEILHEIKDNTRLVISYQCKCYEDFPNFNWINLWEYLLNIKGN